jgi:diacylglycerol kinase (ATP)
MSTPERCIVINPAAAAGETGKKVSEILALLERHLGRDYTLFLTGRPGEATKSVRWAVTAGAKLVVAVGGDGTFQEVVNGFFSEGVPLNPDCCLGVINAGTGAGFAQSFGLPPDIEAQAALVAHGQARRIDIGRAVYANGGDRPEERYFLNECQAGIGGIVVRKVEARNKKNKRLGGRLAFAITTLAAALSYPNRAMSVEVDGRPAGTHNMVAVIMANGNRMAGGMRLAPQARLDDGLLDILFIHGQSVGERLRNFPRIYSGKHTDKPGFSYFRAQTVSITSEEKTDFEADGELWGSLPCRVEVLPAALRVISPNPFGE